MTTQDPWSSVKAEAELHADYLQGCRYLKAGDIQSALGCFRSASEQAAAQDPHSNLYTAARGYAQVLLNDASGLNNCRAAGRAERQDADVHEYLAKAELRMRHRRQACETIARGLRVDPRHQGLRHLRRQMGVRRPPALGFLSRENLLNRIIGRLTYRSGGARSRARKK